MRPQSPVTASPHPADAELLAFALGRSKTRQRAVVADHLAACAGCTDRLGELLQDAEPDALLRRLRASDRPATISDPTPIVGPPPIVVPVGLGEKHLIPGSSTAYELLPGRRTGPRGVVQFAREFPGNAVVAVTFPTPDPTLVPGGRERVARILRELYAVEHPNLLMPRSIELFGESWGVISDSDDGVNFHALACAANRPTGPKLADYFRQAAEGLAAAHAQHIVHGDLHLPDLILFPDGRVRVTGFLPPRLRSAPPAWDPAADIVALGHCFAALLTGRPHAIGSAASAGELRELTSLPAEVRRVLGGLTTPDPAGRLPTMADAAKAFAKLAEPPASERSGLWRRLFG